MQGEHPLPQQASKSGAGGGWGMGSTLGAGGGVMGITGVIAMNCAGDENLPMQFSTLPESEHPVVTLRPITAADIPGWFGYLTRPAVYEHTSWKPQAPSELDHYANAAGTHTPASVLRLAIADRASGVMVGSIGFHSVAPENRSAELAYDLSPTAWGQGIASGMVRTLVAWAHGHVGLLRVQATALESNTRSMKVLERCGFQREGLLHSYRLVRGRPGNFFMYAHVVPPAGDGYPAALMSS